NRSGVTGELGQFSGSTTWPRLHLDDGLRAEPTGVVCVPDEQVDLRRPGPGELHVALDQWPPGGDKVCDRPLHKRDATGIHGIGQSLSGSDNSPVDVKPLSSKS